MSAQLIPIRDQDGRQAVSGRDLHSFLEVTTPYTTWISRMIEYGFTEGQDFLTFLSESTGGRPSTDHALTLDMAKELSMIQRTERGKQARQYFIECERRVKALQPKEISPAEQMALGLQAAQKLLAEKDTKIAELAPKAEAWDDVVGAKGTMSFRDAAKVLHEHGVISIGGNRLIDKCLEWGWLYRPNTNSEGKTPAVRAKQAKIEQGIFVEKATTYTDRWTGEKKISTAPQVRVTGKGIDAIRKRLAKQETEQPALEGVAA
ncbi:antA/AntB antirepressor family protein [Nesterenkonia flava]|uniref:AntA/AntB antirepressor family protein n=1 Tax=Nesterenkonia flava TaxID=469799 RepID=A0ABU1FRX5_9MICC|nr:antA/AntB antirepressor family protein [Nesterenkonia flava]MDR5711415.1 antA/AntB antirepressor family protein [Nesterenkonia flava]